MTRGDMWHILTLNNILKDGYWDENPRPHYEDIYEDAIYNEETRTVTEAGGYTFRLKENQSVKCGGGSQPGKVVVCTPAHTLSINHVVQKYDLSKGECPIETLRPIAWKSAIKEILWIYQMQSNKLSDLHDLGVFYWDDWDIGDGTIGCRYGETVRKHKLTDKRLKGLKADPFGRRHIISLLQEDDFDDETGGTTKGLIPCCYETIWNVRRGQDGELYLDMLMNQRSSDYETSCAINEIQYIALQMMFAADCGYKPGIFTHVIDNVQIYDRHIKQVNEILSRNPVECTPTLVLHSEGKGFYDFTIDDFEMLDYPLQKIKDVNPQLHFDLGI